MGQLDQINELRKLINLTGERAKLDAKANETYIVYKTAQGQLVKEYADGKVVPVSERGNSNA